MCEAKPGKRCAGDTCGTAAKTSVAYADTYPDGPPVNPLTGGAAAGFAHPAQVTAEAEAARTAAALAAHRASTSETTDAWNAARADATEALEAARLAEVDGRQQAQAAIKRAEELYMQAGVQRREAAQIAEEVAMNAGLGHREWVRDRSGAQLVHLTPEQQQQGFLHGKPLALKTKRNHYAQHTKAAVQASKGDETFQIAAAAVQEHRTRARNARVRAEAATYRQQELYADATRIAHRDEELRIAHAQAVTRVQDVQALIAAGADPEGGHGARLAELSMDSIAVEPDGGTNLWMRYDTPNGPAFERVTGFVDQKTMYGPSRRVMVTDSGREALVRVHHHSFRRDETGATARVWVAAPASGSRPVKQVEPDLLLRLETDSGD